MSRKTISIKLKKLDENAVIPTYAHVDDNGTNEGDVGMDLTATFVEYSQDLDCYIYHTGLAFESTKGFGTFIYPRSSNRKTDCYLTNSVGIVDSTLYRGEILVCYKSRTSTKARAMIAAHTAFMSSLKNSLKNPINLFKIGKVFDKANKESQEAYDNIFEMTRELQFAPYEVGKKIAQMVVFPYPDVSFQIVDSLTETSRGEGSYGSTDK